VDAISLILNGSCGGTARFMSAYADGDLRRIRRWRVARHLQRCERCQAVYRALLATIDGLRGIARAEPPARPGLADEVVERIRREGPPA
jgi:anti-sigma factor RsiW